MRPLPAILEELDQRDLLIDFKAIAKRYRVTMRELLVQDRGFGAVARARRDCWKLLKDDGWSYVAIAKLWGIDHSSVMYGIRKAASDAVMAEIRRAG